MTTRSRGAGRGAASSSRESWVGTSEAIVTSSRSALSSTAVVPATAERRSTISPPTWLRGSRPSHRAAGSWPSATAQPSALASTLPSVSVTGCGDPAVPEVCTTRAGASGGPGGKTRAGGAGGGQDGRGVAGGAGGEDARGGGAGRRSRRGGGRLSGRGGGRRSRRG